MADALRLCLGTLTVLRVPPPRRVDPQVGRAAMLLAPLAGLLLGAITAAVAWGVLRLAGWSTPDAARGYAPLLAAVVAVGTLALLTRSVHLDGLADTADGLGSGRRGDDALAVMKRSDIGPFGVVTLVLVLLLQVAAVAMLLTTDRGPVAVVVGVVAGRATLVWSCRRGVPAARSEGLGAAVAGTVPAAAAFVATAVVAAAALVAGVGGPVAVLAAALTAVILVHRCVARFGGVTGDVLGAAVEIGTATALVVLALS